MFVVVCFRWKYFCENKAQKEQASKSRLVFRRRSLDACRLGFLEVRRRSDSHTFLPSQRLRDHDRASQHVQQEQSIIARQNEFNVLCPGTAGVVQSLQKLTPLKKPALHLDFTITHFPVLMIQTQMTPTLLLPEHNCWSKKTAAFL